MSTIKKHARFLSILMALLLLTTLAAPVFAAEEADEDPYKAVELAKLLAESVKIPEDGTADNTLDWLVFVLSLDSPYRQALPEIAEKYPEYVKACAETSKEDKPGDLTRWLLALRSVQGRKAQFEVADGLLERLLAKDFAKEDATNAIAYTLFTLDAYKAGDDELRETLRGILTAAQREDGGYNWQLKPGPEDASDPDTTAAVITALARYREDEKAENQKIRPVVEKALEYLKSAQLESGGFGMFGDSAESAAEVLIAHSALGLDTKTEDWQNEWSKGGKSVIDAMQGFRLESQAVKGGSDGSANTYAGVRVLLALTAISFQGNVYDFVAPTAINIFLTDNYMYIVIGLVSIGAVAAVIYLSRKKKA